jgi:transposase
VARRLMTNPGDRAHHGSGAYGFGAGGGSVPLRPGLSACLGLTPVQRSTGAKQKLGQITKMGEGTLRWLLVIRASAVIKQALIRGAPPGSWLAQMLTRKLMDPGRGRPGQQDSQDRLGAAVEEPRIG